MSNTTTSENLQYLQQSARFPKNTVTPVTAPTLQVSSEEWNRAVLALAKLHAETWGGTVSEYVSVKSNADQTLTGFRIYSDTNQASGNILSGSSLILYAFRLEGGEKFKMTGMKNDPSNPSACWAVYSEYMTLSTDSETSSALAAAYISGSSDTDSTPGRSGQSAEIQLPAGARMIVISVPSEGDTSTIEKYAESQYAGVVPSINTNTQNISALQSTASDHNTRINQNASDIDNLNAVVNGGESEQYESIKSSGTIYAHWRVYGDGAGGGGYIIAGDESCSIIALAVTGGDKIRLTGLKNSTNNPSLCWAVYSEYITPATDAATMAAMSAAMIAYDSVSTEGRSNVSASFTLPNNAAMLIVSVPASGDASTVEKMVSSSSDGLVNQVHTLETNVKSLQNGTSDLPTIRTNVSSLQSSDAKQSQSIDLLQNCVATDAKALLSATRNTYGLINGGRITNDGIIAHGNDGNTTYIIALSAFNQRVFSASGLANNATNASLCWAVYNIPEADVDWTALDGQPYMLDWSNYLMSAYSDTSSEVGRSGVSFEMLDLSGTGATFLVLSCLTASASDCVIRNYDTTQIATASVNAAKAADLVVLKNVMGRPSAWNARTSAATDNLTATMTLNENYANVVIAATAATSGQHGMWLGFEAHNVVAGHKYIMMLRYRAISGIWGASYYNNTIDWSGDGYVRNILTDESDFNVWKFDIGSQYFNAPSSGNLWIDFVVYTSETTEGAATVAEFDILPMLIDVTGTDLTCDALAMLIDKSGVFYESLMVSNYAINPLMSVDKEVMVTLGDSTTGMMCWQPQLARMKGWHWDQRQIGGLTFNGVGFPYTAMGIGGTCVEPLIYGDGTSDTGCSQYIRARYIKYYEPTIIFVMCSYNGAHAGDHWGGNEAMPVQPADYGLAALIASGMNYATGTYEGTYFGEEIDLVSNPSQEVPSFAASYFGMIWRIINDNPAARVVLITMMSDFMGAEYEVFTLKNEVIKHAAEVFHLPLVDAEHAGLNKVNRLTTRYDGGGVHFNVAGGTLLAKHIAANC